MTTFQHVQPWSTMTPNSQPPTHYGFHGSYHGNLHRGHQYTPTANDYSLPFHFIPEYSYIPNHYHMSLNPSSSHHHTQLFQSQDHSGQPETQSQSSQIENETHHQFHTPITNDYSLPFHFIPEYNYIPNQYYMSLNPFSSHHHTQLLQSQGHSGQPETQSQPVHLETPSQPQSSKTKKEKEEEKKKKWLERVTLQYSDKPVVREDSGKDRIYVNIKHYFKATSIRTDVITSSYKAGTVDCNGKGGKTTLNILMDGFNLLCQMNGIEDMYKFFGMMKRKGLLDEKRMQKEKIYQSSSVKKLKDNPSQQSPIVLEKEGREMSQLKSHQTKRKREEKKKDHGKKKAKSKNELSNKTSNRNPPIHIDAVKQVLVKNRKMISKAAIDELRLEGNVKNLTTSTTIQHIQPTIDMLCTDVFNVKVDKLDEEGKIIYHSLLPTIACYVLQHQKWISLMKEKNILLCKEDQEDKKDLIVALNLDYAANSKLTTLTTTIVNSKCFGSGQSRVPCMLLAVWNGGEEDVVHVAEHFKREIEILRKHGVKIGDYHCSIEVFLTMDLKALSVVCPGVGKDAWCPYCEICHPTCS